MRTSKRVQQRGELQGGFSKPKHPREGEAHQETHKHNQPVHEVGADIVESLCNKGEFRLPKEGLEEPTPTEQRT